jgi:serine/threonine protein kinase HipA of HipAB toxin-antitoxin module
MSATSESQLNHREKAESLLFEAEDWRRISDREFSRTAQLTQLHATLAQADAIDRLTAALERMEFPALEVKRELTGGRYVIRVKR